MANILDIQTVGGVLIASVDSDPSLGLGTDLPVGSTANAIDGSGSFYKRSSSLNDWVNTSNNALDGWVQDDLIVPTGTSFGQSILMVSTVSSGGTNIVSPTNLFSPDINGVNNKARYGLITTAITTVASSRAVLQQPNLTRYQIDSTSLIGFGADVAFNGGQIDLASDVVYPIVGFANAGVGGTPTQAAYVRPPYLGETNFYKCILTYFDSGTSTPVNIIFDTTVPYDSTNNRFMSIFVLIDGINDLIKFTIKYDGNTYTQTINNVLATYPDMWSGSIINSMTISISRVGTPVVGVARSIVVDKLYRYIKPNYNY